MDRNLWLGRVLRGFVVIRVREVAVDSSFAEEMIRVSVSVPRYVVGSYSTPRNPIFDGIGQVAAAGGRRIGRPADAPERIDRVARTVFDCPHPPDGPLASAGPEQAR